jgi:hypothetical protein
MKKSPCFQGLFKFADWTTEAISSPLSRFFLRRGTQDVRNGFHGFAPVCGIGCIGCQTERPHGISRSCAVAEETGTRLARDAKSLMPLHGIDVAGDHEIAPEKVRF